MRKLDLKLSGEDFLVLFSGAVKWYLRNPCLNQEEFCRTLSRVLEDLPDGIRSSIKVSIRCALLANTNSEIIRGHCRALGNLSVDTSSIPLSFMFPDESTKRVWKSIYDSLEGCADDKEVL
jgi:hypothetical protein